MFKIRISVLINDGTKWYADRSYYGKAMVISNSIAQGTTIDINTFPGRN